MSISLKKFGGKSDKAQQGFSLIELMIALTLGLIITGVVVQIFSSSRSTYDLEEGLAEVQEQGRFAMEFLAKDIRQAGNFGCAKLDRVAINSIVNNPVGPMNLLADPYNPASTRPTGLIIYEYTGAGGAGDTALTDWTPSLPGGGFFNGLGAPGPQLIPNSDVIVIQYAIAMNVQLYNPGSPTNANLQLIRTPISDGAFQANDIILISDCRRGDMFRATSVSSGGPIITITHAASGNTTPLLATKYDNSADVMKLATRGYFIGVNTAVSPEPALYRLAQDSNNWTPQPLVEGVEQLKVLMGIDATTATSNDNSGLAETYLTPGDMISGGFASPRDMSSLVDVKVGMIVRSSKVIDAMAVKNDQVIAENSYSIFGTTSTIYRAAPPTGTFDPELYRRRRLFTMTVNKRNK